jgi:hypothetical protein
MLSKLIFIPFVSFAVELSFDDAIKSGLYPPPLKKDNDNNLNHDIHESPSLMDDSFKDIKNLYNNSHVIIGQGVLILKKGVPDFKEAIALNTASSDDNE